MFGVDWRRQRRLKDSDDDDDDDDDDVVMVMMVNWPTACVRYTAENVHTNVSTAARRSRRRAFCELTFDNILAKNLSR